MSLYLTSVQTESFLSMLDRRKLSMEQFMSLLQQYPVVRNSNYVPEVTSCH